MNRAILLLFLSISLIGAEPATSDQAKEAFTPQIKNSEESMMLIWPEVKKGGDLEGEDVEVEVRVEVEREDDEDEYHQAFENAWQETEGKERSPKPLVIHREPLEEAMAYLARRGALPPFLIQNRESKIFRQKVTFSIPRSEEPDEVLKLLSSTYGFEIKETGEIFVLSTKKKVTPSSRPISVHLEKAEFSTAVMSIAKLGRLNLSFSHNLSDEPVTLHWQNVDAVVGLKALMKSRRMRLDKVGNVYLIREESKKKDKPEHRKIFKKWIQKGHSKEGHPHLKHEEIIIKK